MATNLFGGIEGGGTKFVCAVGTGPDDIRAATRFPTTTPEETLDHAVEFFRSQSRSLGALDAIGIASFGPLDPNPASVTYGHILPTPKPGWSNVDFVGAIRGAFDLPIAFDTDVNGAALGEWRWGAAQGLDTFIYLTIGTGIGGGGLINGKLMHGLIHPEMGHILLPRDPMRDSFEGICPFHGDCFEGLASGPSIEKRWGQRAEMLSSDHPAWNLEAEYIALALSNYILVLSPQRIVLGGGVVQQGHLIPKIRKSVRDILNHYVQSKAIGTEIDSYIVPAALGGRAGVLGAIALAQEMVKQKHG